jgi:hypothetical protein
MNIHLIDILLDYFRLVAYTIVLLTVLKGIYVRKWSGLLFVGDLIMVLTLIITLVYAHLFGMDDTIGDEIFLTLGASAWAIIHFVSMIRENTKIKV